MDETIIAKERVFQEFTLKLIDSSTPISLDGELKEGNIRTLIKEGSEYADLTFIYDPNGAKTTYEIHILPAREKIQVKNLMFHYIHNSWCDMLHGDEKKYTKWYIFVCKA